jgi:hypothetical protein
MTAALFTVDDVAQRLHKSRRWLQTFLRDRPIGRLAGRTRLFTEYDVLRLIEELPCPSSSAHRARVKRRTITSGAHISASTLKRALALAGEKSRKGFSARNETTSNVVQWQDRASRPSLKPQSTT